MGGEKDKKSHSLYPQGIHKLTRKETSKQPASDTRPCGVRPLPEEQAACSRNTDHPRLSLSEK